MTGDIVDFCRNGHPRTDENTSFAPSTYGRCKVCSRESAQRSRDRKRERERVSLEVLDSVQERLGELGLDPRVHRRFRTMEDLRDRVRRLDAIADVDPVFLNQAVANQVRQEYGAYREKYPEVASVLDEVGTFDILSPPPVEFCVNGHEINEENSYVKESGARVCRVCHRARMARYRARKNQLDKESKVW